MFNSIKHIVGSKIINTLGWHTKRKILVIESDDWGSIRMPSIEILNILINKKLEFDYIFEKNDTLASYSDLENLFEILNSVKDKNNKSSVITANCVVTNPDFEKIKKSDFLEYHYELITETLTKYYPRTNPFNLWKQGIENSIFFPQFHGREHLNVQLWLKLLRKNISGVKEAFNHNVFSQIMDIPNDNRTHVLSSYDYRDESDQDFIKQSIKDGVNIFKNLFGYDSMSAISPCYIWDDFIEKCYLNEGIKYIQGGVFQKYTTYQKKRLHKNGQYHYCGEKNKLGQNYLIRNCYFEPSHFSNIDVIDNCMCKIKNAFRWRKPAIISTHRLNYIGSLNKKNRDDNLLQLRQLLRQIVRHWPEVEFMTSNKLGDLIKDTYGRIS